MQTEGDDKMPQLEDAKPARILLVISSLECGGAERVMTDMANHWSRMGREIVLVTWSGPDVPDFYALDPAVTRIFLNVESPNTSAIGKLRSHFSRIRQLRNCLSERSPHVVLSFIDWSNVLTILAAFRKPARVVVSERIHPAHNNTLATSWKILRKAVYRMADTVVSQTKESSNWVRRHCGVAACTIPNPLRDLPSAEAEREQLILGIGRLRRQKGFDLLIRAFASIHNEFNGWRVMIVGRGMEEQKLIDLRDELGLTEKVEIVSPVRNIEDLMARASLVVQPSRFEGFPNVVLEAMGMGAAVVSADCPSGPAEIINDGENGCLVPVDDREALARKMAELLRNPSLRQSIAGRAVDVRTTYGQERIMRLWEDCLFPDSRTATVGLE
ncbi:MAG: glycosyltransferase family 4 protein [Woeseiaceae bacterium]